MIVMIPAPGDSRLSMTSCRVAALPSQNTACSTIHIRFIPTSCKYHVTIISL